MASSSITLKASGLRTSPNQLEVSPGSLDEASNVIIKRDDIIESRRGYKLYGSSFGSANSRAKQIISYKTRLIRHFADTLQFQNGIINDSDVDQFSSFSGTYEEPESGIRIKSIESNGNLYFTTSDGVKKISVSDASQFSTSDGFIVDAGAVKAVDQTVQLVVTQGSSSGFLPQDSAVAYRVVWGYKDNNQNIILGTPSQRSLIYNSLLQLIVIDFNNVLQALDDLATSGSLIDDGDYVSSLLLPFNATGTEIQQNLLALSTKIDTDIIYADVPGPAPMNMNQISVSSNVATITFTIGTPSDYFVVGSRIALQGLTSPNQIDLNGDYTIASLGASQITFNVTHADFVAENVDATGEIVSYEFRALSTTSITTIDVPTPNDQRVALQSYLFAIITTLQSLNSNVIPTVDFDDFIAPLDITTTANVKLTITIPSGVTSNYFFQIYRSPIALATGTLILETDVVPSDELQQVYEAFPTASELEDKEIVVVDSTPDSFRGAYLYTNEATGEGILQGNDIPPFAVDINKFKNVVFYANTRTRQALSLNLLGVAKMIEDYNNSIIPTITIADLTTSNTYRFVEGVVEIRQITCDDLVNTDTTGYFSLYSANDNTSYYVWLDAGGGSDPAPSGYTSGIRVDVSALLTAAEIAEKIATTISVYVQYFTCDGTTTPGVVTITNTSEGPSTNSEIFILGGIWASNTTQAGQGENVKQETTVFTTVADVANSLAGLYFGISSAFTKERYYVWFRVSGSGSDPLVANRTAIRIDLTTNDSASTVAEKIAEQLQEQYPNTFETESNSSTLTIRNLSAGPSEDSIVGTSTFTLDSITQGALDVLLSSNASPSVALDETTRSLVRVINKNQGEIVYAYYISSPSDVPGKMYLQERELSTDPFYIVANNSNTGTSFNPDLSPSVQISNIATGTESTMIITTSSAHGLTNLDYVVITNSNSINNIDGEWQVTVLSPTTFRIPQNISTLGNQGALIGTNLAEGVSSNDDRPNRVYYSKVDQPEAVPLVNFFDVGARDKAILRIFPLRDTLFIFKEDGLFRISGESAPFVLSLLDSSCVMIAPDSLGLSNNLVYVWTRQGISVCSEAGVTASQSRDIDPIILSTPSINPETFRTATFGLGYESDNSYLVWTILENDDEYATIAYRYSNLTNTWTTYDKTNTCGIINPVDDKMYLGAGDTNYLEQERKNFNRTDYSDREFTSTLSVNKYFDETLLLSNVNDIESGDVIVQDQTLTVFQYNGLLEKLDLDPGVGKVLISSISTGSTVTIVTSTNHTFTTGDTVELVGSDCFPTIDGEYEVTVINPTTFTITPSVTVLTSGTTGTVGYYYQVNQAAEAGDDMRSVLVSLTQRLDIDPGLSYTNYFNDISTKSGSISEIAAGFPTEIQTVSPHELFTDRVVVLSGTNSSPTVNETRQIIVTGSDTFTIPISVTTPGTTGSYSTANSDFRDLKACYNKTITNLNADVGANFSNYREIDDNTTQEAIVVSVDKNAKSITLNLALDFIVGDFIVYKKIPTLYTYTPITMGDSLNFKQLFESTLMFANKAFTSATLSFSTDLLPKFESIPFRGDGNGIFGIGTGFFGNQYFGGASHGAPFRTYIPRNCQRCRYIIARFEHAIAREQYAIYGITITGNIQLSSRAYR